MLLERLNTSIDLQNLTPSLKPDRNSVSGCDEKADEEAEEEEEEAAVRHSCSPAKPQHPARPGSSLAFQKWAGLKACTLARGSPSLPSSGVRTSIIVWPVSERS